MPSAKYAHGERHLKSPSKVTMSERPEWRSVGGPWSGVECATIIDLVNGACARHGESPALIFDDGLVVAYAELLDLVESFAGYLRTRIQPGDRVAIMLGNRTEFIVAWLAVVANRGIAVSVNPASGAHDAGHVLGDSGAVVAVVGEAQLAPLGELQVRLPALREVIPVLGEEPHGLSHCFAGVTRLKLSAAGSQREDLCHIFYTSGTTGSPKGCLVDHEWWLRTVDVVLRRFPRGPEGRELCCLQFFYSDPGHQLLECMHTGGALVVMRRFSVSRFWDVVRRHDVTSILSFSSIPAMLYKAPPDKSDRRTKVRYARQLAMPRGLHRQIVERWGFPWVEGYGITEGNVVTGMPLDSAEKMIGSGSIGIPVPETDVRLLDESGEEVQPGQTGEFVVRGPGMFRGYLNRPDSTAQALRDGWLYTGDLGRRDDRGFYYFMGRKKDMIRRSGENISAAEVEDVLRSHPKILDAAVLAVPDELRGEEVMAIVQPVAGMNAQDVPPEELSAFCRSQLAPFKVPRYIDYRTDDFPRTPTLRIIKDRLVAERPSLTAGAWDREAHIEVP